MTFNGVLQVLEGHPGPRPAHLEHTTPTDPPRTKRWLASTVRACVWSSVIKKAKKWCSRPQFPRRRPRLR